VLKRSPRTRVQAIPPSADLYLNKLAPSMGSQISSTKKADGRSGRRRRSRGHGRLEITKIVRKDNDSLTTFKERWTMETGFIMGVPKVMKISSFMDSVKSPKLAKRFSNKVPTTVNEMMERLDNFIRSEEAYAITELPKGEVGETHRKVSLPFNRRDNRLSQNPYPGESRMNEYRRNYRGRKDTYLTNRTRDVRAPYPLERRVSPQGRPNTHP
nr:reverse transcriptase domain-containing protein [Tanacetum cinerariifolium]GEY81733.1 reverse transcriptase domain-containing protein [Tanacetum cinerariifolium]